MPESRMQKTYNDFLVCSTRILQQTIAGKSIKGKKSLKMEASDRFKAEKSLSLF